MRINDQIQVGHLRAAVALGSTGSFTEAAREMGLSQSSLSRKIADLERALATQLFRRTTRRVESTAAGRVLVAQMRSVLVAFDQGMEQLYQQAAGEKGSITIGCLPSIAASYLPGFIRDFSRDFPGVRVEVLDALKAQVLEQVRAGEVDFGITALSSRDDDLHYERIGADQFYCALPRGHRLSEAQELTWGALEGEPFITFSPFSSISRPVETALEAAGVVPSSTMVGSNVGAVAGLVASGLGVTAIPGLVRPLMEFAQLRFIPLRPTVEREICIVRRKGEGISAAAERFILSLRRRGAD
ncbi:LysR family transcriptional regulator [Nesterenkonia sp. MY13]|uniref:LysR family transcriptional regulator n=1 Tax=Nesterenkonia sedimenti TaxID=1463632 RepID=A0A7X8TI62_9MICC|nr:LysR family transcriptional regulator [Nesterenkonia sedimenti]NLS09049.1 LysR family transcriptional regulator [Nesterenkonia sedimenti]